MKNATTTEVKTAKSGKPTTGNGRFLGGATMAIVSFHSVAAAELFIKEVLLGASEYERVSPTCIRLIERLRSYAEARTDLVFQVR